jgi:two-component system, NtrC family, response regulator AtoC
MNPLKILVIDDERLIRWSFEQQLTAQGYRVFSAETGEEGLRLFESYFPDIVFLDNKLPGIQGLDLIPKLKALSEDSYIVFMTAYGSIDTAVKAMKSGAREYVNKPFSFKEILAIIEIIREKISRDHELQLLKREERGQIGFEHIIGHSPQLKKTIQLARKIAGISTTTILLTGESGTGKDLLARAIHNASDRQGRPFVTINCSSLPENLLESELFGHEQGAFTDAKKLKKGLFEMAEGGTVFLDEIGEINLATQVRLLGVIENRTIRRVGGTTDIPVDIRIIAATNKDLEASIASKAFREDLYYRLKVFHIVIPPLREHFEDIRDLAEYFTGQFNVQFRKHIRGMEPGAWELLEMYPWPGNVRELRNVIERAVILESGDRIQIENLPSEIINPDLDKRKPTPASPEDPVNDISEGLADGASLYGIEKQTIIQALEKAGYNQTKAALLLKITRDTLRYKMKKYHL